MNNHDQIIALAKFEGWSSIHNMNTMAIGGVWGGYSPLTPIIGQYERLPDYLSDYNAVRRVVELLSEAQLERYIEILAIIVMGKDHLDDVEFGEFLKKFFRADAKTMAEAVLKVIEQWKES
jgi:hypothetical protein